MIGAAIQLKARVLPMSDEDVEAMRVRMWAVTKIQALWRGRELRRLLASSGKDGLVAHLKQQEKQRQACVFLEALWRGKIVRRHREIGDLYEWAQDRIKREELAEQERQLEAEFLAEKTVRGRGMACATLRDRRARAIWGLCGCDASGFNATR